MREWGESLGLRRVTEIVSASPSYLYTALTARGVYRLGRVNIGDSIYVVMGKLSSIHGEVFPVWLLWVHPGSFGHHAL